MKMKWKWNENEMKMKWKWNENEMKMKWKWNENEIKMKWKWHENEMKMTWKWNENEMKPSSPMITCLSIPSGQYDLYAINHVTCEIFPSVLPFPLYIYAQVVATVGPRDHITSQIIHRSSGPHDLPSFVHRLRLRRPVRLSATVNTMETHASCL